MRSTRICALYCALLISIMQLASTQALGQARTSAPATAQSLPPALLDTPASSKPGPYLAQKRARILNLQAEEERFGNQSPELLPTIYDLAGANTGERYARPGRCTFVPQRSSRTHMGPMIYGWCSRCARSRQATSVMGSSGARVATRSSASSISMLPMICG